MPNLSIPKLNSSTLRGWPFVLVAGTALAVLASIGGGGTTGCVVRVTSGVPLNVRVAPSATADAVEAPLPVGQTVDAKPIVRDGFRELADGRWAVSQYLTPEPGSNCS